MEISKRALLWGVIGLLLVGTIFLTFRASSTGSSSGTSSNGQIDTSGWTANEIMNYQMHGIVPARAGGAPSAGGAGQVGGC